MIVPMPNKLTVGACCARQGMACAAVARARAAMPANDGKQVGHRRARYRELKTIGLPGHRELAEQFKRRRMLLVTSGFYEAPTRSVR